MYILIKNALNYLSVFTFASKYLFEHTFLKTNWVCKTSKGKGRESSFQFAFEKQCLSFFNKVVMDHVCLRLATFRETLLSSSGKVEYIVLSSLVGFFVLFEDL